MDWGLVSMDWKAERRETAYFMRRIYRRHLTTTAGGNISRRVDEDHIVMTPAGIDKARVRAEQVAIMDLEGRNLTPHLKPSSEGQVHLRIYERYPQVQA